MNVPEQCVGQKSKHWKVLNKILNPLKFMMIPILTNQHYIFQYKNVTRGLSDLIRLKFRVKINFNKV